MWAQETDCCLKATRLHTQTYRRGALALAAKVSHFFTALRSCESVTQFFARRCRRRRICTRRDFFCSTLPSAVAHTSIHFSCMAYF